MNNKTFEKDAKQIVDLIFDNKMFKENITRDDMNYFEELILYLLSTKFKTYKKVDGFLKKIQKDELH